MQLFGGLATGLILLLHARIYVQDPGFWAEDLKVFWRDQYAHGLAASLFSPYSGYLHAVPRLIAWGAWVFPIGLHPLVYFWSAFALTAWTGSLIAASVGSAFAGLAMAAALVAVPDIGEVWLTPTNLQWVLGCALPVVLLMPRSPALFVRIQQAVLVVLAGLTGPFAIVAAPLWLAALWRAWRTPDDSGVPTLSAALAALTAAVQGAVLLANAGDGLGDRGGLPQAVAAVMQLLRAQPVGLALLTAAICCGLLVLALAPARDRGIRLGFIVFGGIALISAATKLGVDTASIRPLSAGDRYFYVPTVMLSFAMITLVSWPSSRIAWVTAPAALVVLAVMVGVAVTTPLTARLPAASTGVWREMSAEIGKRTVSITIPPQWTIEIPPK